MTGKPEVQDHFLNELRTSRTLARVVLLDGRELRGTVQAFDTFTIRMTCKGDEILIFKSAIAVIGPAKGSDDSNNSSNSDDSEPPTTETQ
jgi:host factor-I protein